MKAILSAISVAVVAALWLWGKCHQAKAATRDLGDGGVQKLFDEENSKYPTTRERHFYCREWNPVEFIQFDNKT
jgi:hypothetical protein